MGLCSLNTFKTVTNFLNVLNFNVLFLQVNRFICNYTKYDIQCNKHSFVIAVIFLVTLSTNKFTNIVIPSYFQFIQMPIDETKFGMVYALTSL